VDEEDLRFLVVLGWEFFLLCLFDGFPVKKKKKKKKKKIKKK